MINSDLEINVFEDGFELSMHIFDGTVVEDEVVSCGDRATFFEVFDFANVALADFGGVKRSLRTFGDAFVAKFLGSDDGDESEVAGEFIFEGFVLGPRVDSIKDDAFLAGFDEVFGLGDGLANDPIFAFFGADFFAEFAFIVGGVFDAAFLHFFINHATKIDSWHAVFGKVVDGNGFTAAAHADDSDDFDIS